jgi:hypothetical protein
MANIAQLASGSFGLAYLRYIMPLGLLQYLRSRKLVHVIAFEQYIGIKGKLELDSVPLTVRH